MFTTEEIIKATNARLTGADPKVFRASLRGEAEAISLKFPSEILGDRHAFLRKARDDRLLGQPHLEREKRCARFAECKSLATSS